MVELTPNNLRYLMKEKGVKVIDVADALNISLESTYPKIRENRFSIEQVRQLGRLLNEDFIIKKGD